MTTRRWFPVLALAALPAVLQACRTAVPCPSASAAAPALRIRGRVLDENGTPLPGAGVVHGPREEVTTARALHAPRSRSGADGCFEIAIARDVEGALLLVAAPGRAAFVDPRLTSERIAMAADPLDLGDVRLPPGIDASGCVRDENGEPVAGALVRAVDALAPELFTEPSFGSVARTDANGGFVLPGVFERAMAVVVSAPGHYDRELSCVQLDAPLELSLARSGFVEGFVCDADGEPYDGFVSLQYEWPRCEPSLGRAVAGRFRIPVQKRCRFGVRIGEPGGLAVPGPVLDGPQRDLQLRFAPPADAECVRVRAIDTEGRGIPNAYLLVPRPLFAPSPLDDEPGSRRPLRLPSWPDGVVRVPPVWPAMGVELAAEGFLASRVEASDSPGTERVVTLERLIRRPDGNAERAGAAVAEGEPGHTVSGRITGLEPSVGWRVVLEPDAASIAAALVVGRVDDERSPWSARSAAVAADGTFSLAGCEGGDQELALLLPKAPRQGPVLRIPLRKVTVPGDQHVEIDARELRPGLLHGSVRVTGADLAGRLLVIAQPGDRYHFGYPDRTRATWSLVERDGRWSMQVAPGPHIVVVVDIATGIRLLTPRFRRVNVPAGGEMAVDLQAGVGTLVVHLDTGGRAVTASSVCRLAELHHEDTTFGRTRFGTLGTSLDGSETEVTLIVPADRVSLAVEGLGRRFDGNLLELWLSRTSAEVTVSVGETEHVTIDVPPSASIQR